MLCILSGFGYFQTRKTQVDKRGGLGGVQRMLIVKENIGLRQKPNIQSLYRLFFEAS